MGGLQSPSISSLQLQQGRWLLLQWQLQHDLLLQWTAASPMPVLDPLPLPPPRHHPRRHRRHPLPRVPAEGAQLLHRPIEDCQLHSEPGHDRECTVRCHGHGYKLK